MVDSARTARLRALLASGLLARCGAAPPLAPEAPIEPGEGASLLQLRRSRWRIEALSARDRLVMSQRARSPPGLADVYHNSTEIFAKIEALAAPGKCATGLRTERVADQEVDGHLFVAHLGAPGAPKRVLVAANEHGNEAVTAEVALRFIEAACANGTLPASVGFTVVPVVNAPGRRKGKRETVDEGKGEGSVDLNRQGDVDYDPDDGGHPKPFGSYQARILRDLAAKHRPLAFVDLHSCALAMMTPWGHKEQHNPDYEAQLRLLRPVKAAACPRCPLGTNRQVIGYDCPGELLDHMYAKAGVKYSYVWELFDDCNPPAPQFDGVVGNWTRGLEKLAALVDREVGAGERSAAAA